MNPYNYPVIANYEDLIEDIDGQNKRVKISYTGTESEGRLTVNEFNVTPVESFFMSQENINLSVMEAMYLTDYKIMFEL